MDRQRGRGQALDRYVVPGSTVVHAGDVNRGYDAIVAEWCSRHPDVTEETHPADPRRYGRGAVTNRNQQMVDMGADFVLGFPEKGVKWSYDCIKRAEEAGIRVLYFEPQDG